MAPSRWTRVQSIFDAASEIPTESREDYLTKACGGNVELSREVESLLSTPGLPTGLIAAPPVDPSASSVKIAARTADESLAWA